MSDVQYWLDEYRKEVEQVKIIVDRLKSLVDSSNTKAVEAAIKDCDAKVVRAREVKKSFGLEVKLVRDKGTRADLEEKGKKLDFDLNDLTKTLNKFKADNSKNTLFGDVVNPAFQYSTEGKDNEALLGEAHKIQDLTFESLSRTKNMILASKEVGAATVEQLKGQREQIIEIENEVDQMDSNLVRAEKLVFNFTRRMATDRIIQVFTAVNIVVLLGLILYVAGSGQSLSNIGKQSGSSGPDVSSAPSRTPTFAPTIFPTTARRHLQHSDHKISRTFLEMMTHKHRLVGESMELYSQHRRLLSHPSSWFSYLLQQAQWLGEAFFGTNTVYLRKVFH